MPGAGLSRAGRDLRASARSLKYGRVQTMTMEINLPR
jgi:hypothetical protein